MESPSLSPSPSRTLSHSGSLRRRSSSTDSNSPEFEFWSLGGNPLSFPQPPLHSADELFSDGFLLPLQFLHLHHDQRPSDPDPDQNPKPDPEPEAEPEPGPGPVREESELNNSASITSSAGNPILTASKRWKEIFKRGEKKALVGNSDETMTKKSEKSGKKRGKKTAGNNGSNNGNCSNNHNGGNSNSNPAELNINIWPFSRSRSDGNNSGRSRPAPAASSNRKVSSAPCSRSNSSGDSKSRRAWPNSPGRSGVHLGRTSPVWQVKRNRAVSDEGRRGKPANIAGKGRVLNLNVPMCMRYRHQLSCRSDEHGGACDGGGGGGGARSGGGGNNGNFFGLRGLFTKKSVLTV